MRKNFGEKFLKQIKCVFPQAYSYAWNKIMSKFGDRCVDHALQIIPNLNYKEDILNGVTDHFSGNKGDARLGPEMMVERRNIFHNSLLQIVKDQHTTFLAGLDPPIEVNHAKL